MNPEHSRRGDVLARRRYPIYGLVPTPRWWSCVQIVSFGTGPQEALFSLELVYSGDTGEVVVESSAGMPGAVVLAEEHPTRGSPTASLRRNLLTERLGISPSAVLRAGEASEATKKVRLKVKGTSMDALMLEESANWNVLGMLGGVRLHVSGTGVELDSLEFDEIGRLEEIGELLRSGEWHRGSPPRDSPPVE